VGSRVSRSFLRAFYYLRGWERPGFKKSLRGGGESEKGRREVRIGRGGATVPKRESRLSGPISAWLRETELGRVTAVGGKGSLKEKGGQRYAGVNERGEKGHVRKT